MGNTPENIRSVEEQLILDKRVYGNAFYYVEDGKKIRVSPIDVMVKGGTYVIRKKGTYVMPLSMGLCEAISMWDSASQENRCAAMLGVAKANDERAVLWLCDHVQGFTPKLVERYTSEGTRCSHWVASNGTIDIALIPFPPIC